MAEACTNQNPVLPKQGNDVGYGSDGNQIEILPKVEALHGAGFLHGVTEFKDDACAAEVVKVGAQFRINEGVAESRGVL